MMTTQSVAQVSFFTRVSDKTVGGTYMTLLNTISNLGTSYKQTEQSQIEIIETNTN